MKKSHRVLEPVDCGRNIIKGMVTLNFKVKSWNVVISGCVIVHIVHITTILIWQDHHVQTNVEIK